MSKGTPTRPGERTLGIDLASQASQTAACAISWAAGGARVESIESGLDDGQLRARMDQADLIGIDAPFGWPVPFSSGSSGRMVATSPATQARPCRSGMVTMYGGCASG